MVTKEQIIQLLKDDDRAIARALLVLTARQTQDEQAAETTRYLNGRGYRPCHARMGASMSKFFERNNYLSPKQIAYWRVKDKTGKMRIEIYAGQLLEEAQEKAAKKAKAKADLAEALRIQNFPPGQRDYGNDMERLRGLEYEFGMCLDSDDPKILDPIKAQIDEIKAYWKKIGDEQT